MSTTTPELHLPSLIVLMTLVACAGSADSALLDTASDGWRDADGDGTIAESDCDDHDPDSYPGAAEYCDGADNDCDGVVDDNALDTIAWYADNDGDGFGNALDHQLSCRQPGGRVTDARDCDDGDPSVHPDASEDDDGVDNDCDGDVDEGSGGGSSGDTPVGYGELDLSSASDWWTGDNAGDAAGAAVAGGYDYTGDGTDDLLLAAPSSSSGGQFYFVTGESLWDATGATLNDASTSGSIGFTSSTGRDQLGAHLAMFPDVDGDNIVDFAVGAPGRDDDATDTGTICLYFSSEDSFYYVATSAQGAQMGPTAHAGDANDDGLSDILVGGPGLSSAQTDQGFAELMLGDRSSLITVGAFWMGDSPHDAVGGQLGSAGDLDGDGYDEVVIAGTGYPAGGDSGAAWVVMGRHSWPGGQAELSDADHQLVGSASGDLAGSAIAGGQDMDADGYDDLIIAAPGADGGAGAVYLWSGDHSWGDWGRFGSLEAADGVLIGQALGDAAGSSVDLLEDFDGDGVADLVVGAPSHSGSASQRGAVYMMFGASGAWTGSHSLADADVTWRGDNSGDRLGTSVSTAGDTDNDGHTDLVMGAPGSDWAGSGAGSVYLILGY
ncbi:MAG: hypothetical protein GY901_11025 [Actinomycetia bacterium]|nr:hypothetical protein [Actinomycetes bacterium]